MRWYRSLTLTQQRVLLGLAASVIAVFGLLGWSVWTTLKAQPSSSPLPTATLPVSVLPSPTPRPTTTPSPTPKPTSTPPFDVGQAGIIAAEVADARGILPRWNTPLTLVDAHDLSTILIRRYSEHPPLPLEMRTTLEALRLWFWKDDGVRIDPYAQSFRMAAFYVSDTEELYLRRDWFDPKNVLEIQLAYGYARALPDQHGELPRLIEDAASFDRQLALTAVGDGDALLALWLYAGAEPGTERARALTDTIAEALLPRWKPDDPLLDDLSRLSLDLGAAFATALYAEGGTEALNTAVQRPPRSTEQLLHVDRYLDDDEPVVLMPIEPALERDWTPTQTDTLGEAMIRLTLLEWSNGDIAPDDVASWGGDLLQIWTGSDGADVVLWQTAWDSGHDAATFYGQLYDILPRPLLPGLIRDTTPSAALPRGRWWAGRQGAVFLYHYANRVWLVWGTDPAAVETVGAALP